MFTPHSDIAAGYRAMRHFIPGLLNGVTAATVGPMTVASQYARITAVDYTGKTMTKMVKILSESKMFLTGLVVNKQGEDITPKGFDQQVWVVAKDAITKIVPLRVNLTYDELEEDV